MLLTLSCTSSSTACHILSFAVDTTIVGLMVTEHNMYREEVQQLVDWCKDINLSLNFWRTKEIVDFRRPSGDHSPLRFTEAAVKRVKSTPGQPTPAYWLREPSRLSLLQGDHRKRPYHLDHRLVR